MDTAVIEFDALADAVRPAAQHHNFLSIARQRLAFLFVSGVHVGSMGSKLRRTGINPLVYRVQIELMPPGPHSCLCCVP